MKRMRTRIFGGASLAAFAAAATLALVPGAHAEASSMGDGSVRSVAPSISPATYVALQTPSGGEVVSSDF